MNSLTHNLENNFSKLTIQKNKQEETSNINLSESLLLPINTDRITSLNLSNLKLNVIPEWFTFNNLIEVDLSGNQFQTVPYLIYENNKIQQLNLSNNKLTCFDMKPKCCSTLLGLNLSENYLECIPSWIFSENCDDLQTLILNNNPFMAFGVNLLGRYMKKLTTLQLNNSNVVLNKDNGKNRFLNEIPKLEQLHLDNVQFKNTNLVKELCVEKFAFVDFLKEIHLTGLGLSVIPDDFILFKNLEVLDLHRNYISWFPGNFTQMIKLKIVDVSDNEILLIPKDIGDLVNLEKLFISGNCVGTLPDSIQQLKLLNTLDCYDNYFTEHVIDLVTKMEGILAMDFEQNMFEYLDENYTKKRSMLREDYSHIRKNGCKISEDEEDQDEYYNDDDDEDNIEYSNLNEYFDDDREEENWDVLSENSISDDMNLMIPQFRYYARNKTLENNRLFVDPLYFEDAD